MSHNRINLMLSKIGEILNQKGERHPLDAALMIDYTKIIYADLLDLRREWEALSFINSKELSSEMHIVDEKNDEDNVNAPSINVIDHSEPDYVQDSGNSSSIDISVDITGNNEDNSIVTDEPYTNEVAEDEQDLINRIKNNDEEKIIEKIQGLENSTKTLGSYIGLNDRIMFTSDLFENNKDAYQNFIDTVSGFSNYLEAESFINIAFDWSKDEKSYQLLQGILVSYYNNYK